jgi:hypothetical protein
MTQGYHCGALCYAKSMPPVKKNATQKGQAFTGSLAGVTRDPVNACLGYVKKVKVAAI